MKRRRYNAGFTLVEMLIVVAVIAILAAMVVGLAGRIDTQSKERALKSTFALLDSALQEYYEYWDAFPDPNKPHTPPYSSRSAALYDQLYSTPTSRQILEKISAKLLRDNPPQIYDPWGKKALDYIYASGDNFPLLKSAGPDGIFDTSDDISSR
jgi:prepilin-type N-terminal cleavage/methylation domain-containing protein